ncbi:MAG: hypothetical protein ACLTW9_06575 [Enterocloster sp.]
MDGVSRRAHTGETESSFGRGKYNMIERLHIRSLGSPGNPDTALMDAAVENA